jgi:hypothetical protein
MRTFLFTLAGVGFLLMAGCQGNVVLATAPPVPTLPGAPGEIVPITSTPNTEINEGISMPDPTALPDSSAQTLVQLAMASLAEKLQIPVDQIQLVSIEAVTWPDSSLGCPQLGIMYTQVITPGFQIVLEANGKTYPYHSDDKDRVVYCGLRSGGEYFLTPSP